MQHNQQLRLSSHPNDALFLRLGLPSTLVRHENAALFLRLGLPSTLIRNENAALFLRLGLPSTLIRNENAALFLRLGLPSTLIRHENAALFLRLGLPSTLICHENAALFLRLGLPSTLICHENAALFLRLGLTFTLICHENGAFRKRSSNRRDLRTPTFRSRVDGKHFENRAFWKWWPHDKHLISLTRVWLFPHSKSTAVVIDNDILEDIQVIEPEIRSADRELYNVSEKLSFLVENSYKHFSSWAKVINL